MVEYSKDKRRKAQFSMFHLTAKTETELKSILDELIQKSIPIFDNKLKRVILFGSYARGDYDEESDVDVMFLIDDEAKILQSKYRKPIRKIIADIDFEYDVLLCSVLQNEQDFYACVHSIPFYHNVEKEGITLYGQQPTAIL
jgi:predicted nucleotidyltransferase